MLDHEVQIAIKLPGCFFDCGFRGRLERVQTLPPDDTAVLIVFGPSQGIALDPAEIQAYIGDPEGNPGWLEFHLGTRLWLVIEPGDETSAWVAGA